MSQPRYVNDSTTSAKDTRLPDEMRAQLSCVPAVDRSAAGNDGAAGSGSRPLCRRSARGMSFAAPASWRARCVAQATVGASASATAGKWRQAEPLRLRRRPRKDRTCGRTAWPG